MDNIDALELTRKNIREYSYSVAQGRAYPSIIDGLKESYRRSIYGMYLHNTHKTVKVAELAAFALPYHPHPSSISGVIVSMGDASNKLKLLETQGNFGNSAKGIQPAADRYIGGYLSNLAESLLCDSVEYCNMVKGEIEHDEPEALPALLPLCFINGLTGIPSGLPTLNIPTLNLEEMIDYYVSILSHKSLDFTPRKLPSPNLGFNVLSSRDTWDTILKTGKGSLKLAPTMELKDNTITITAIPGNKDVDAIKKIIEKEYLAEKVDIRDESTDTTCIVIEKCYKKQCDMKELFDRLYAKLQVSINYNMAFYDKNKIYVACGFDKVVKENLSYVIQTHYNRISKQIIDVNNKLTVLKIIENLKQSNFLKKIAELSYEDAIESIASKYKTSKEVASKVLQKPMSYLTKEHQQELIELEEKIRELQNDNNDIYEYLIKKYKALKKDLSNATKDKFIETKFC